MNINYELYKIFYEVATCGNITKASQKLMISQPAVTKQIKVLESQLGGELFIRTKRGVILTENGKEIYNYVKQGMHCFESAELQFSNLKQLETGTIKIGISTTLCRIFLLKYLNIFHQKYPNIAIQVFTDPSKMLKEMLKDGTIDVLIAKDTGPDDELNKEKLGTLHHCFIASEAFKELKNQEISLNDLNTYQLLLPKEPSTTRKLFDNFCKENNIELTSKVEIASSHLLEDFVEIGLGIGLATKEFIEEKIDSKKIFTINVKEEIPSIPYYILTLKNSFHSFGTNKLIEIILEDLKNQD